MANKLFEERLVDSNKRALIKYVYISDGTAEANTLLIDTSSLAFSMNANNQIMASNTHAKEAYRVSVKRISGSARVNSAISLIWRSATNTEFATVQTGSFDYSSGASGTGGGIIVNPMAAGANGDVLITVRTPLAGDSFTMFVELVKNPADYDQGQTADPIAFNRET
jgi:hypothetical protein